MEIHVQVYTKPRTGVLTTIDIDNKTFKRYSPLSFGIQNKIVLIYKERLINKVDNWNSNIGWFDDKKVDVYSFVFRFFELEDDKSFIEKRYLFNVVTLF